MDPMPNTLELYVVLGGKLQKMFFDLEKVKKLEFTYVPDAEEVLPSAEVQEVPSTSHEDR